MVNITVNLESSTRGYFNEEGEWLGYEGSVVIVSQNQPTDQQHALVWQQYGKTIQDVELRHLTILKEIRTDIDKIIDRLQVNKQQ